MRECEVRFGPVCRRQVEDSARVGPPLWKKGGDAHKFRVVDRN